MYVPTTVVLVLPMAWFSPDLSVYCMCVSRVMLFGMLSYRDSQQLFLASPHACFGECGS